MKHQRHFVGRLELYELAGHKGRWFCLLEPLTFVDDDGKRYSAPAGTLTDFASIPRWIWSLLPSYGKHTKAAVIHDAFCAAKAYPSRFVHDLFLRMLETCGVSWAVRTCMHRAVRWFGPRFDGA
jgi:hypothetical protein